MPYKPMKLCGVPGCPTLTESGTRYCPIHARKRNAEVAQQRPRHHKFYATYAWVKARRQVLDERGRICIRCGSAAHIEVDHIIPVEVRPDLATDPGNLQVLCHRCHSRKTADQAKMRKGSNNG